MRILFDQGTPVALRNFLIDHDVSTAYEKGWASLKNGELLKVADIEFDIFVTTDKSLYHQQNLTNLKLAILVLPFASWPKLQMYIEIILSAVNSIKSGDYIELQFAKSRN